MGPRSGRLPPDLSHYRKLEIHMDGNGCQACEMQSINTNAFYHYESSNLRRFAGKYVILASWHSLV